MSDYISREAVKKLTKEMYLKVANTEYDVHSISDCTSYVASKCREYIDEHIRAEDCPSAFEGMTNGEVMNLVLRKTFPRTIFIRGIDEYNKTKSIVYSEEWENAPYQKGGE